MVIQHLYFSPTHSSRLVGKRVAGALASELGQSLAETSITLPRQRQEVIRYDAGTVLVCAYPVYGGRVPAPLAALKLECTGCMAIPIAVYGNREFDDALREGADLLASQGCKVIAAIAAIAQHTFDAHIAAGRPDEHDLTVLENFAAEIAEKIRAGQDGKPKIPGSFPYREPGASPAVTPLTSDKCDFCGVCADVCPVGVIDRQDERIIGANCILCGACVKFCPQRAKTLPAPFVQKVSQMLGKTAGKPKQPELFI